MLREKQKYTSASTSINSTKVPSIFKRVEWIPGTKNLDYGGGKYDTATEYLDKIGVVNKIYDPYNRDERHNELVLQDAPFDTSTLSNVLNVVQEHGVRREIVQKCLTYLKKDGILYIMVYEGNKSGIGRESRKNCWQENRKTKSYLQELHDFNPQLFKGIIQIIKKE